MFPVKNKCKQQENESENYKQRKGIVHLAMWTRYEYFQQICWCRWKFNHSSIQETAAEINGGDKDEEEYGNAEDAAKVFTTHTAALETLCDYFQFYSRVEETFSCLDELEKIISRNILKIKKSSYVNYFSKK